MSKTYQSLIGPDFSLLQSCDRPRQEILSSFLLRGISNISKFYCREEYDRSKQKTVLHQVNRSQRSWVPFQALPVPA